MNPHVKAGASLGAAVLAIVAGVIALEGGYVNNPADPGGRTNHGITVQVARDNGYDGDMRDLPREFAEEVYAQKYVHGPGFAEIVAVSPALGTKLVDAGVNTGTSRSAKWFQEAVNHLSRGGADYARVEVDGHIGPQTLMAYAALERKRGRVKACELTLKLMDVQQGSHYLRLNKPMFVVGWVDHRLGNVALAQCAAEAPR